jgi:hypothetical protein
MWSAGVERIAAVSTALLFPGGGLAVAVKSMEGDKAKVLGAQVAELQAAVTALQKQLSRTPTYFDDPLADPLRP